MDLPAFELWWTNCPTCMRVQRFYDEAAASRAAPCVRGVERQIRILLTRQQEQTQNTDKLERELTNLGNSHVPRSSQEMESFKLLSGGLAQVLRDVRKSLVAQRTELLELLVALRPRDGVSNAGKVYLPRQPAQVIRSLTSVSTLQAFAETALQDATQTVNFLQDQLISLNLALEKAVDTLQWVLHGSYSWRQGSASNDQQS
eukprot:GHVT01078970.1.p1 GENE.GHVT01078970.1~~GHVT01078970.1.p1  ORF type:complete len:202 (+),score=20.14 GHVT01078970.1:2021-2626(+)